MTGDRRKEGGSAICKQPRVRMLTGTVGWRVMDTPTIKTVSIERQGRFWAVRVDGELLALVLYKKGAVAVRDLVARMAGIASAAPPNGSVAVRRTRKRNQPGLSKPPPARVELV